MFGGGLGCRGLNTKASTEGPHPSFGPHRFDYAEKEGPATGSGGFGYLRGVWVLFKWTVFQIPNFCMGYTPCKRISPASLVCKPSGLGVRVQGFGVFASAKRSCVVLRCVFLLRFSLTVRWIVYCS